MKRIWAYENEELLDLLVGHRVVAASTEEGTLTLDNGTVIAFDKENDDCCSFIELTNLATTDNIITAARFEDNEEETGGEGEYKAWLHVVTADNKMLRIAEADGDASNGYYLHGFALGATVTFPEGMPMTFTFEELEALVNVLGDAPSDGPLVMELFDRLLPVLMAEAKKRDADAS